MEPTLEGAMALARSASGPLSLHLPAFVQSLIDQSYATVCVRAKAWRAAAFDTWLAEQGIQLAEVQDHHVDEFLRRPYVPRSDCRDVPRRHEPAAVRQLLGFLRNRRACPPASISALPCDPIVDDFARHLTHDRGLAATTIGFYRSVARALLTYRFGTGSINLSNLQPTDIIGYVAHVSYAVAPRGLKWHVSALRAFMRFAVYRGDIDETMVGAVPAVAAWSTTPPLPRAIPAEHARLAIDSCDPSTAVGRRDRAILLLLARLGLRGGEIITLRLEDMDWDAGLLMVRGKNGHQCLMPLPVDVGDAIAAYLRHGRPVTSDRHLFLRSRAPFRGLLHGSDGIGSLVRNALERAGIHTAHRGSHQFRHALAVRLLRDGASMPEIGELLRHRSQLATSMYAKVDLGALRKLAMPWPGSRS